MAAADDRDGRPAGSHGRLVRRPVDPVGQAGHDRRTGMDERGGDPSGRRPAGDGRPSRAHDRDGVIGRQGVGVAEHEQRMRRHRDAGEARRVGRLLDRHDTEPEPTDAGECHDAIVCGPHDPLRDRVRDGPSLRSAHGSLEGRGRGKPFDGTRLCR